MLKETIVWPHLNSQSKPAVCVNESKIEIKHFPLSNLRYVMLKNIRSLIKIYMHQTKLTL